MTANLSGLTIGSLTLSPTFASGTAAYTATTTNNTNIVRATPAEPGATVQVKVNGTVIQNGTAATWNTGTNTVTVLVVSGKASKTYTVTVTKTSGGT